VSGEIATRLARALGAMNLPAGGRLADGLLAYLGLLQKWNRVYNLTAVREPHKMLTLHLLDSLAVLPHLPPGSLLDVGAGAGLPGLALALAQPERPVTLIDSSQKKATFMRQAALELGLDNVRVEWGRVEDLPDEARFDVVISRAFAEIAEFVRLAGARCAPGGVLAAMKGVNPVAELAALPAGWAVARVVALAVPGLDAERHLVLLNKREA